MIKSTWLVIIMFLLLSCQTAVGPELVSDSGITYEYFEINGMPCIYIEKNQRFNHATGGPSCDWSKWKGQ